MATFSYFAFISYRHTDKRVAKRLQRMLESYNLPTDIRQKVGEDVPDRFKVFRDTDELTSGILSEELQKKLRDSKFLIVICSPESAKSKYVGEEIAYFRSLGRERQIIPFIISGVPHEQGNDCYHPQLTFDGLEILGIDVRSEGSALWRINFHRAFIRLVAKMLDLSFDVLWNRRKRQLRRRIAIAALASAVIVSTIIYLAWRAKAEAGFDSAIVLHEAGGATTLPLSNDNSDTIYVFFSDNDVRALPLSGINDTIKLPNIPGRLQSKPIRTVVSAYGCFALDTAIRLTPKANAEITVTRDPVTYGRISYLVVMSDGETPLRNATFDFGFMTATTDAEGRLDAEIPAMHQRAEGYEVTITSPSGDNYYLAEPLLASGHNTQLQTIIVGDEPW